MKKILIFLLAAAALTHCGRQTASDYAIVAGPDIVGDAQWGTVVEALSESHPGARVFTYAETPREALDALREAAPRYVAFVERPERIGRNYIIDLNRMCREVDDDIYNDYLWGVITGYDAAAARRIVCENREPLVISSALSTLSEVDSGKWFDRFGGISDREKGVYTLKEAGADSVTFYRTEELKPDGEPDILRKFADLYDAIDPDLVLSASHATENNLEMPYSLGNVRAKEGTLYADLWDGPRTLKATDKRKVYLPIGNCLIGNVNNTTKSMAIAWMNGGHASTMVGYVVPTWYGRNGWGALKYWLTTPGRYTLSEAFFLNQQDLLHQLDAMCPEVRDRPFPFSEGGFCDEDVDEGMKAAGRELSIDELGFFFDRDVVAYYGDPAWEVRLKELPAERDYDVQVTRSGKQVKVTVRTHDDFNALRMAGDRFKSEHVGDLPFSCFFPERLNRPRLAEGQSWNVAVDDDFLLVYDPGFEPGQRYEILLDVE